MNSFSPERVEAWINYLGPHDTLGANVDYVAEKVSCTPSTLRNYIEHGAPENSTISLLIWWVALKNQVDEQGPEEALVEDVDTGERYWYLAEWEIIEWERQHAQAVVELDEFLNHAQKRMEVAMSLVRGDE